MDNVRDYNQPPRRKEEYENPSDYYEHLYHYLRRFVDSKWLRMRDRAKDFPRESLDEIIDFSNSLYIFLIDAEGDYESYWRNGVINVCKSGIKKVKDKLFRIITQK